MQTISVNQFLRGIKSIFDEKPLHYNGCDGSNGYCDYLGLIRGGLIRGGAVKIQGLNTLDQIHHTLVDVRPINQRPPTIGCVVLRGSKDNYTDIGVVVNTLPFEVVHMTHVTVKKDNDIDAWDFAGWLPYVAEEHGEIARVYSGNGFVRLLGEPKLSSKVMDIPDNSEIELFGFENAFAKISYRGTIGYVMTKYIKQAESEIGEIGIEELERAYEELERAYVAIGNFLRRIKETQNEENKRSRLREWRK